MSLELLQEPAWLSNATIPIIVVVIGALFVVQAVFSFLLWRKGETKFLIKFISFTLVALVSILLGIGWGVMISGEGLTLLNVAIGLFVIFAPIVMGIHIFIFVRDTWFPGTLEKWVPPEKGVKSITPSKKKEAPA